MSTLINEVSKTLKTFEGCPAETCISVKGNKSSPLTLMHHKSELHLQGSPSNLYFVRSKKNGDDKFTTVIPTTEPMMYWQDLQARELFSPRQQPVTASNGPVMATLTLFYDLLTDRSSTVQLLFQRPTENTFGISVVIKGTLVSLGEMIGYRLMHGDKYLIIDATELGEYSRIQTVVTGIAGLIDFLFIRILCSITDIQEVTLPTRVGLTLRKLLETAQQKPTI